MRNATSSRNSQSSGRSTTSSPDGSRSFVSSNWRGRSRCSPKPSGGGGKRRHGFALKKRHGFALKRRLESAPRKKLGFRLKKRHGFALKRRLESAPRKKLGFRLKKRRGFALKKRLESAPRKKHGFELKKRRGFALKKRLESAPRKKHGFELRKKHGFELRKKHGFELRKKHGFELRKKHGFELKKKHGFELKKKHGFELKKRHGFRLKKRHGFRLKKRHGFRLKKRHGFRLKKRHGFGLKRRRGFALKRRRGFALKKRLESARRKKLGFRLKKRHGFRLKKRHGFRLKKRHGFRLKRRLESAPRKKLDFELKKRHGFRLKKRHGFRLKKRHGFRLKKRHGFRLKKRHGFRLKKRHGFRLKKRHGFRLKKRHGFRLKKRHGFRLKKRHGFRLKKRHGFRLKKRLESAPRKKLDFELKKRHGFRLKKRHGFRLKKRHGFRLKKRHGFRLKKRHGFRLKKRHGFGLKRRRGFRLKKRLESARRKKLGFRLKKRHGFRLKKRHGFRLKKRHGFRLKKRHGFRLKRRHGFRLKKRHGFRLKKRHGFRLKKRHGFALKRRLESAPRKKLDFALRRRRGSAPRKKLGFALKKKHDFALRTRLGFGLRKKHGFALRRRLESRPAWSRAYLKRKSPLLPVFPRFSESWGDFIEASSPSPEQTLFFEENSIDAVEESRRRAQDALAREMNEALQRAGAAPVEDWLEEEAASSESPTLVPVLEPTVEEFVIEPTVTDLEIPIDEVPELEATAPAWTAASTPQPLIIGPAAGPDVAGEGGLWRQERPEAGDASSSFEEALQQVDRNLETLVGMSFEELSRTTPAVDDTPVEVIVETVEPMPAGPAELTPFPGASSDSGVESSQTDPDFDEWYLDEDDSVADTSDPAEAARLRRQRLLRRAMENMGTLPRSGAPVNAEVVPPPAPAPAQAAPPPSATISNNEQQLLKTILDKHLALQSEQRNHFTVLGLPRQSSRDQVKAAFLGLAKVFHPDRLPPALSVHATKMTDIFEAIREAYEVLFDEQRRREYEKSLDSAAQSQSPEEVGPARALEDFKKGDMFMRKRDFRTAEDHFARAFATDAKAEYLAARGWAIYMDPTRKAEVARARQMMLDAVKHTPSCDRAHYQLGVIARVENDMAQAERHFREAVRANPRHLEAAQELRLIEMRKKKDQDRGGKKGFFG